MTFPEKFYTVDLALYIHICKWGTWPLLWSSGQFLATDPEALVRFPALPEKKVVGLEWGPLSLVSTTDELLERKVAAPV
jgi:hypothetical protein